MRAWFANLAERERRLVLIGSVVGVILLIVWQSVKATNRKRSTNTYIPRTPSPPPGPPPNAGAGSQGR